jgi:zinc protease
MRPWLATLPLLAACGAILKPAAPDRRLAIHTTGDVFESDRGYQFAVLPEPGANVVRLNVRYPVGAANDPVGKEGLAHLVEHLLFEKEIHRGATTTSIVAELGRVAMSWNAETHADYTEYQAVAPASALDELIGLEADRLANGCGGLTEAIVSREREVVLNELRTRLGASGAEFTRMILEVVYPPGHPYRRTDSVDSVAKLGLGDVCEFIAAHYYRGTAYVVASGAIDGDAMRTAANHHLGRVPKRTAGSNAAPAVADLAPGTFTLKADVEDPYLFATWPLPKAGTREGRLLELVYAAIPQRLEEFAYTFRWGHAASFEILGGASAPVLAIKITLNAADNADDAIAATEKSIDYAKYRFGHEQDNASWQGTWQAWAQALLTRWESLGSRNELFTDFLQYDKDHAFLVGHIDELDKATPSEVKELADTWLDPKHARYLVVTPSGAGGVGARTYHGGAEAHATTVDGSLADQALATPIIAPPLDAIRYHLDNGLEVVLWPHGTAPLVHGSLVIHAGTAQEPAGADGLASFMGASAVTTETLQFNQTELSTRVDELIVRIGIELRSPGYALSEDEKSHLRGLLQHKGLAARRTYDVDFWSALYGEGHPYTHPPLNERSLETIHHDLVMDWARKEIVPRNATLILTGQFDPALIKQHIAYNLDQVSGGSRAPDITTAARTGKRWIRGDQERPSPTVELDVGFVGGSGIDRDYAKRLVLEAVLGGQLQQLRGKQALTYGMSASYQPRTGDGLWLITGDVDGARAAEAGAALIRALDELRGDPESYRATFVLARQKVLESLLVSTTDANAVRTRLAFRARFNLADDFDAKTAAEVAALTLTDFHAFLRRELAVQHQVFGAFGNAEASAAALAGAQSVK